MRRLSCVLCCALVCSVSPADDKWVTIKGQVVFPAERPIPKRKALNVSTDKPHCTKDGPILDETDHRQPEEPRDQERGRVAPAGQPKDAKAKFAKEQDSPGRREAQSRRGGDRPAVLHVREARHAAPASATRSW